MNNTVEIEEDFIEEDDRPTAIMLVQQAISDISGTSITNSNEMVDRLLDIQQGINNILEGLSTSVRMWMNVRKQLDFYEETFGVHEIPEGWQPKWMDE